MKKILIVLIAITLYGCKTSGFQPPCTDFQDKGLTSMYFPIEAGNSWTYDVTKIVDGEETREDYKLELCDLDTIYYVQNGERIPFEAYRACRDGKKSMNFYFVKCENGTHLLTVNDWYYKELQSGWVVPNNPKEGEQVENKEGFIWRGQQTIKVPKGEYQVWVLEELRELNKRELKMYKDNRIDGNKTVRTRYYFAEGIGLIKTEQYGAPGELLTTMQMTDFNVKDKRGGKAR